MTDNRSLAQIEKIAALAAELSPEDQLLLANRLALMALRTQAETTPDQSPLPENVALEEGEYIGVSVFGDPVIINPEQGSERPLVPTTHADIAEFYGLWKDRDDLADSAQWVHDLRRRSQRKTPLSWPKPPIS